MRPLLALLLADALCPARAELKDRCHWGRWGVAKNDVSASRWSRRFGYDLFIYSISSLFVHMYVHFIPVLCIDVFQL